MLNEFLGESDRILQILSNLSIPRQPLLARYILIWELLVIIKILVVEIPGFLGKSGISA